MSAQIKANELANAILSSGEYRSLLQSKQMIERNPENKKRIMDFKKKQFDFQVSLAPNKQPDKGKMDSIKRYYDEITKNNDIKTYLEAEKGFNEFVGQIIGIISDRIEKSLK